ncbi:hypothetical protein PDE_09140 [Penicillium oxalicum 114-2]|uniref:Uncharacterized protein n=1 Tax=Penicillium oxalicum (strain 114-2 / CGMCC 5302) TaxID=933388 RepID=S7ZZA8_PENO1|nr:hypothetical protein PDE_09140 [Penicillium oxalicum 114-2]
MSIHNHFIYMVENRNNPSTSFKYSRKHSATIVHPSETNCPITQYHPASSDEILHRPDIFTHEEHMTSNLHTWKKLSSCLPIVVTVIPRKTRSSDVSLALFVRFYQWKSLKQVFAESVTNKRIPTPYIKNVLFFPGESWLPTKLRLLVYGTRQCEEYMGMQIGQMVGYFVFAG